MRSSTASASLPKVTISRFHYARASDRRGDMVKIIELVACPSRQAGPADMAADLGIGRPATVSTASRERDDAAAAA